MAGWEKALLFLRWTTWIRSLTPHFPALKTSSGKQSRSPRISRSCCEQLRKTNTTGRNLKFLNLSSGFHLRLQFPNTPPPSSSFCSVQLHLLPMIFPCYLPFPALVSSSILLLSLWLWCHPASPSTPQLLTDHVSVKVFVGSGTVWDVSALWCPGLRRPTHPFSHSTCGPLTPPPGTLASVSALQAQFQTPLHHCYCLLLSPIHDRYPSVVTIVVY